jgi:DNA-nicking Smr family endonuclease
VRKLAPDEAELWAKVAATIRPLSREREQSSPERGRGPPKAVEGAPSVSFARAKLPPPRSGENLQSKSPPRPGTTLDGSWDKRIRSGDLEPDRVLDLHGMNLDHAWNAIDRTLEQAIQRGDRVVLLITGHHRAGAPPVERGKIRAAVHDWLAASRHAGAIAAVRGAHRRHGGGGSLYLVLRRQNASRR